MFQRDYLMRQVQQLVQVLQKVLFLKSEGQIKQAREEIRQAFDDVGGEGLREKAPVEVIDFCVRNGSFNAEFAIGIADLLKEEGDLLAEEGDEEGSKKSYRMTLLLYREVLQTDGAAVPWDIGTRINNLEDICE